MTAGLALLWPLLAAVAAPAGDQQAQMTGRFVVAESEEVLRERWGEAVDRFVPGLPWAVRGIARTRLKKGFTVCEAYRTRLTDEAFFVQCEGQPELSRRLDNTEGPLTTDDGRTVEVSLALEPDTITVTFDGERGGLVSIYRYAGDALTVELTMAGRELPEPLAWFVRYRRDPPP